MSQPLKKVLIFSGVFYLLFIIRFYLSTLFFNNDYYSFAVWVDSLKKLGFSGFYERDYSPWAQANYPPLANYLFLYLDEIAHFLFDPNLSTKILASFYKFPSLIPETLLITYLFLKKQKLMAFCVALNPAIFYNTLFWGQTDGAVASLVFFSILALGQNQIILGILIFTASLLMKQSAIVFLPVVALLLFKLRNYKKTIIGSVIGLGIFWLSFLPFEPQKWLTYPVQFFLDTIGGQPHQHIASANALNLWFLLGYTETLDNTLYGFLSMRLWGDLIAYCLIVVILIKLYKFKKSRIDQYFMAAGLINFAAFLFLTRIHERYLFPTLIFLLPVVLKKKLSRAVYIVVSLISFINLFWVWYFDHSLERSIYLNSYSLRILSLLNIICFIYLFVIFLRSKVHH